MSLFPFVISSEVQRSREIWGTLIRVNSKCSIPDPSAPLGVTSQKSAEVKL